METFGGWRSCEKDARSCGSTDVPTLTFFGEIFGLIDTHQLMIINEFSPISTIISKL